MVRLQAAPPVVITSPACDMVGVELGKHVTRRNLSVVDTADGATVDAGTDQRQHSLPSSTSKTFSQ